MTQATVFPPPEQAENVLRKNCWRVSTHSSWFLTFSSSLSVSPASSSRSQRKKLVGIIWYLHLSPDWLPTILTLLSLLEDLEFRFYSPITRCALDSSPHNIHIAHFFSSLTFSPQFQLPYTLKTSAPLKLVLATEQFLIPAMKSQVVTHTGGRCCKAARVNELCEFPRGPQPAPAAARPRPRLKYCKLGSQASRAQPGPGQEALQRFRFAILRHRFAPTAASCIGSDLQILNERNLHTKPNDWTQTMDVFKY